MLDGLRVVDFSRYQTWGDLLQVNTSVGHAGSRKIATEPSKLG